MVRTACLLAVSAPAVLLFGCARDGQKASLASQHGTRNLTMVVPNFTASSESAGSGQMVTLQSTYAYDAASGATVYQQSCDVGDEQGTCVEVTLQTGSVIYTVQNSSQPSCCQMPADEPFGSPVDVWRTSSVPRCENATFEACWTAALEQAHSRKATIASTELYHVPAGQGVKESWTRVKTTQVVETSAEGLLVSHNVTEHANVSEIQISSVVSITLYNESEVFDMQPGFPAGWGELGTWWHGSCDRPCSDPPAQFQAGAHRARIPAASALQSEVVV